MWFGSGPRADRCRVVRALLSPRHWPPGSQGVYPCPGESEHAGHWRLRAALRCAHLAPGTCQFGASGSAKQRPAGLGAAHLLLQGLGGGVNSGSCQQPQPEPGSPPSPAPRPPSSHQLPGSGVGIRLEGRASRALLGAATPVGPEVCTLDVRESVSPGTQHRHTAGGPHGSQAHGTAPLSAAPPATSGGSTERPAASALLPRSFCRCRGRRGAGPGRQSGRSPPGARDGEAAPR